MIVLSRTWNRYVFRSGDAQAIGDPFAANSKDDFLAALSAFRESLHELDRELPLNHNAESFICTFP